MNYYNEFDKGKAEQLQELIKEGVIANGIVDTRSIVDVQPGDLDGFTQCHFFAGVGLWSYSLQLAGWPDDREVWTGSCPCTPFSAAGKRKAKDDDRHLWPEWFRLIEARRPLVCFGEQVSSIDGLAWLDDVQDNLDGAGYTCGAVDLCSSCVGSPNIRQRLYLAADRLEHAPRERRGEARQRLGGSAERPGERCDSVWLADAEQARRQSISNVSGGNGAGTSARGEGIELGEYGVAVGLAGTTGARLPATDAEITWRGYSGGLGDTERPERRQDQREPGRHRQEAERNKGADWSGKPGPTNGYWAGADWVLTRPQRVGDSPSLRPIESSPLGLVAGDSADLGCVRHPGFPLAQGEEARAFRLKGYGDGINTEVAAAFVRAWVEERG